MEIPLGNIITGIATVLAVVIANKLTYSRSSKQRLWDLRREAYGSILSELARAERVCDHADQYIEQDEMRYFESKQSNADSAEIGEHMTAARKRFSDDYLILSDVFISMYEQFTDELRAGDPNDLPPEEHEHFATILRKNRLRLMAQARIEMSVRKGWSLRLMT
jgi:hypothetical protein